MKPEDLQRFRTRLEEQLASLGETHNSHQHELDDRNESGDFVGGDRAAELENMEVDSSIAESEVLLTEKVRNALERIDAGTYGICEGCGGGIPLARLEAKPSVSLCLPCQERHEAES